MSVKNRILSFSEFLNESAQEPEVPTHVTNILAKTMKMPYAEFLKKLGEDASDPKFIAAIKAGRQDGVKEDEAMFFKGPTMVEVKTLIPMQNEIDIKESLAFQLKGRENKFWSEEILTKILRGEGVTVKAPLVIFNNKYIVDGHHRWSQVYAMNKDSKIEVLNIVPKNTKLSPLGMLKVVQMSIAAAIGKVPIENVKGTNMLRAPADKIKDYVIKEISDETLTLMKNIRKIESKEAAADYIWSNVEAMQKNNQPIAGAPKRDLMPQTDKDETGEWEDRLKKGKINFLPKFKVKGDIE